MLEPVCLDQREAVSLIEKRRISFSAKLGRKIPLEIGGFRQVVISILTAALTALGTTSCMGVMI